MYIEYLLVHPSAAADVNYQSKVTVAATQAPVGPLRHVLSNTVPRIRATDYERIHFVYTLLRQLDPPDDMQLRQQLSALEVLQSFTALEVTHNVQTVDGAASVAGRSRRGPPGSVAPARSPGGAASVHRGAATVAPSADGGGVDEVESKRLPFHDVLSDPWAVLTPQLTPESVPTLLGLCGPLRLSTDDFYVHLVKRMTLAMLTRLPHVSGEHADPAPVLDGIDAGNASLGGPPGTPASGVPAHRAASVRGGGGVPSPAASRRLHAPGAFVGWHFVTLCLRVCGTLRF